MEMINIFAKQQKLDKAIEKAHGIKQKDIVNNKIIALLVEIGEFANEIACFKYWKKNKNINNKNVLEEYADGIHFFMSFYVQLGICKNVKPNVLEDLNDMFIQLYKTVSLLKDNVSIEQLDKSFSLFLGIGQKLNFDWKEVESSYLLKNKINFERIKNNY